MLNGIMYCRLGSPFVGYFVNHNVVCFKHFDKRRNPRKYQPALKEDMENIHCLQCIKNDK